MWGAGGRDEESPGDSPQRGFLTKGATQGCVLWWRGHGGVLPARDGGFVPNQYARCFLCQNIVVVLYYIKGEHLYLMVIWVGCDIA